MTSPGTPDISVTLAVSIADGQIVVGDQAGYNPASAEPAFDDAVNSGRFVGVAGTALTIVTPAEDTIDSPFTVEVFRGEPADDKDGWDHEVDADLDVPSGELGVDLLDGPGPTVTIPPGPYRVRVSGRSFTPLSDRDSEPAEAYRLRLWPRSQNSPPTLRKFWPGWSEWD